VLQDGVNPGGWCIERGRAGRSCPGGQARDHVSHGFQGVLVPRSDDPSVVQWLGNLLCDCAEAVAPLHARLSAERLERLVTPLATCVGTKSIMVTVDTCVLSPAATREITRWAAAARLHAALEQTGSAESGLALGLGRLVPHPRRASPPR
jgi:hypothetical protein